MPTVNLMPLPKQRFSTSTGAPLAGGKLFIYAAGTTTKQNSYQDASGLTPNANPVILDSRGEASIWFDQNLAYKVVLSPATDTDPPTAPIWTQDGIPANGLYSWTQAGTGAISRTVQDKLREQISAADFNVPNDGVTPAQTTLQAAVNASAGRKLRIGAGTYNLTGAVDIPSNTIIEGDGPNTIIVLSPGINGLTVFSRSGVQIRNLTIKSTGYSNTPYIGGINLNSSNGCLIENVEMSQLSWAGVLLQDSSNNTVRNCSTKTWYGSSGIDTLGVQDSCGIAIRGNSNYNDIHGNRCLAGSDHGISIQNPYTVSKPTGNKVHDNWCANANAYGILVYNGCYNNPADGTSYPTNPPYDMKTLIASNHVWNITGLRLSGASGAGIYLQSAGGTTCLGNHVWDCCTQTTNFDTQGMACISAVTGQYTYGVVVPIIVAHNRINTSKGPGIWAASSSKAVVIEGNSITSSSTVSTGRQESIRITNAIAKVRGGSIDHVNTTAAAINVVSVGQVLDGIEISTSINTAAYGVLFNSSSGGTHKGAMIHNLIVRGASSTALGLTSVTGARVFSCDLESSGVVLQQTNSTNVKYSGNRFHSPSGGYSIAFTGNASGNAGTVVDETNELSAVIEHDPGTGGIICQYGTSGPTGSGLWAIGDRVIQLSPAAGQPKAWRCTGNGNPGTWLSEGNL